MEKLKTEIRIGVNKTDNIILIEGIISEYLIRDDIITNLMKALSQMDKNNKIKILLFTDIISSPILLYLGKVSKESNVKINIIHKNEKFYNVLKDLQEMLSITNKEKIQNDLMEYLQDLEFTYIKDQKG